MVVPAKTDVESLKRTLREHGRGFVKVANRHIDKVLRRGEIYFAPISKYCDCGTALGMLHESKLKPRQFDHERHIERLRRKKWSEAKIQRWLDQKKDAAERIPTAALSILAHIEKGDADPDGWVALIRDLKSKVGIPYAGILLHFYSGDLSERIDARREKVQLDETLPDVLYRMSEDVIYVVS